VASKTLSRYLDGDLSPAASRDVEAHLAECPACERALAEMKALDDVVRRAGPSTAEAPDVAGRVTADLRRRGAFLRARVTSRRRRFFGETRLTLGAVAAAVSAACVVIALMATADSSPGGAWSRRTAPVVADAERVLVRLVNVPTPDEERTRLAWARQEARKLDLSDRLAEARAGAQPALAGDLAYLENTFQELTREEPLSSALHEELTSGNVLERAVRVRDTLQPRG
jgi:anti-sigma factor RsiW